MITESGALDRRRARTTTRPHGSRRTATEIARTSTMRPAVVLASCATLALPTWFAPGSQAASISYLVGLGGIVVALGWASARCAGPVATGWRLVAVAAACWMMGDVAQRILVALGGDGDSVGLPDLFWLASYPLMVAGVSTMVHARAVAADVRHEVRLDVLVVTFAGALVAWKLAIAPAIGDGRFSAELVAGVLYPLGDIALLATAAALLFTPGRPTTAGRLVMGCIGSTLVIDIAFTVAPSVAPGFAIERLDALLLVVNGMLAAAALHASGGELADAPDVHAAAVPVHRGRVLLLGTALVTVSIASAVPASASRAVDTTIALFAAGATSVTVVARLYGVVRKREDAEGRLDHLAHHDHLTGLANRALMLRRLDEEIARSEAGDVSGLVLVYLDLDGFKVINDRYGHASGDVVLAEIGARLERHIRRGDTAARFGGDEFVVLCANVPNDEVGALGERLRSTIARPVVLPGGDVVTVGASLGVVSIARQSAMADVPWCDAETVLRSADAAMYEAKHVGGGVRVA